MPVSVGEFLHNLAKKAGMNPEDENLKNFLLNGDLVKINVPEEIEKGIDNKLISLTDAKNNHPEIKNFYQKQALDGIDKSVDELLEELGADEETKTLIKSERSTYKRVPLLVSKVKELEARKANTSGKTDKAEIQKEIDALHGQIRTEKENAQKLKVEYEEKLSTFKNEYKLESLLGQYKTIYDDLDADVKMTTLKTLINKNLQDNKGKFVVDENGNFILQKEDGTNYYGDNNQQIEPKSFVEQILSRNKLLKVTDQPPGSGDTNNGQPPRQPNGGQGGNTANKALSGLVQNSIKNLEQSNSVSVMG